MTQLDTNRKEELREKFHEKFCRISTDGIRIDYNDPSSTNELFEWFWLHVEQRENRIQALEKATDEILKNLSVINYEDTLTRVFIAKEKKLIKAISLYIDLKNKSTSSSLNTK